MSNLAFTYFDYCFWDQIGLVPGLARALACHRAWWHGTARLLPDSAVPGPLLRHASTIRHGTTCRRACRARAWPCPCHAVPGRPFGKLYTVVVLVRCKKRFPKTQQTTEKSLSYHKFQKHLWTVVVCSYIYQALNSQLIC